jgi:membrane associated rhomboid family serine protease
VDKPIQPQAAKQNRFIESLKIPFRFIVVIWAIHIVQFLLRLDLGFLGVYPREFFGLKGVLFAPLIHADFPHLIHNSTPFFVLSAMIMFFYRKVAVRSIIMIYLLTGLAVWLFARSVFHIGASGVVYGLVSFVFWNGIFRRNVKSIILALIVTFLYSGFFMGILPNQEGISWESHLLGGIIGIFTSFWYKDEIEKDEQKEIPSWEREPTSMNESFFLDQDVFEKTKAQRQKEQDDDFLDWFSSGSGKIM